MLGISMISESSTGWAIDYTGSTKKVGVGQKELWFSFLSVSFIAQCAKHNGSSSPS